MGNPEALLRCAALVEERLREPLTVQEMAEAACWSLYHFCRVFSEAMGMGPYDYLVRRRITEAARELAASERRITDLAFEYQFGGPEVFSRCFRRALGLLPSKLREGKVTDRFLPPLSRELAECISSRTTKPCVSGVDLDPMRLRGLAVLVELDGRPRLAELVVDPSLELLRRASEELPCPSAIAYALLDRVGPGSASLFLGHPVSSGEEARHGELETTLPAGHYLRSAAQRELPIPLLRAHFHSLWYPAAAYRRSGEREIIRRSGQGEQCRTELLVPLEGSADPQSAPRTS